MLNRAIAITSSHHRAIGFLYRPPSLQNGRHLKLWNLNLFYGIRIGPYVNHYCTIEFWVGGAMAQLCNDDGATVQWRWRDSAKPRWYEIFDSGMVRWRISSISSLRRTIAYWSSLHRIITIVPSHHRTVYQALSRHYNHITAPSSSHYCIIQTSMMR